MIVIGVPLVAHATSYAPYLEEHRLLIEKMVLKTGSLVYLYHNGTQDINTPLADNDILIVYRENSSCEMTEVGKIRFRSTVDDNYIKGDVIDWEIKEGDFARKGSVGLLVILPDEMCERQC